ncbi:MAG: DUF2442 domain-containing protein [Bacteroidales bacterium]|nr:DUF2442 domain-containing protein [Bacteroidales bacterium]
MDYLYVTEAMDAGNLCIRLVFNDGFTSTVDIGDFIRRHPHPQYNKYLDPKKFQTFSIENGNVVWGKNWDLIFPIEQLRAGYLR